MIVRTPKQDGAFRGKYKETKTPVNQPKSKVLKTRNITPSRNLDFKGATEGDRYVPQHNQDQLDYAKVAFDEDENLNRSASLPNSPSGYKPPSMAMLRGKSVEELDMYVYRKQGAPVTHGTRNQNVLYKCMNPSSSVRVAKRVYPKVPTQTLDAPELIGDFYMNTIDWSSQQLLAVAIKDKIFTYNPVTSETTLFKDFDSSAVTITSITFSRDGAYLAVGLDGGSIQLYDVASQQSRRKFGSGSAWRICTAAWTQAGLLSFGNRGGAIQTHDTRQRLSFLSEVENHQAEVCGVKWVCNDEYLVSGGADANVNVYTRQAIAAQNPGLLYQLQEHVSTVKSIAECPFIYGKIVATGGGNNDGTVRFWNLSTGELHTTVKIENQVSGISFDHYYREMATSHGGTSNCMKVWKYSPIASEFTLAHEIESNARILNMTKSSCGEFIAITNDAEEVSIFDLFKKDEKYRMNALADRTKELNLKFSGVRELIR